jgi:hypothetical protein
LNCIFRNNKATRDGGALYNFWGYSGNSSPILTNCLIVSNKALRIARGIFNDAVDAIGGTSSPTITNCTFALNQADFGAGALNSDGRNGGVSRNVICGIFYWQWRYEALHIYRQRVINVQLINCSNTRLSSAEAPEMEPEITLVAYPSPVGSHLNVEVRLPEP